jgi:hypothetical protein
MALAWDKVTWFPNGVNQGAMMVIGGVAGDLTLTGVRTTDQIARVEAVEFAAEVPDTVHALTSEFTITADDTINNTGGTDTSDMLLLVTLVLGHRQGSDWIT